MTKSDYYQNILKYINELKCLIGVRRIFSEYQSRGLFPEYENEFMAFLLENRATLPDEVFGGDYWVPCHNYLITKDKDSDDYIFASLAVTGLQSRIQSYLDIFMDKVNTEFSFSKPQITIECPSAIVAMYIFYMASDMNNDEYRQCNNKRCATYYRVDKSHPQKFCDKHMIARRTKRRNAREKERREGEEYF